MNTHKKYLFFMKCIKKIHEITEKPLQKKYLFFPSLIHVAVVVVVSEHNTLIFS